MNAAFARDMEAYLEQEYGMPVSAAQRLVRIKQNSRKRDWTIKHLAFMRLANWWAKRYGGGRPFSQITRGEKIIGIVTHKGKTLLATENDIYTITGSNRLELVKF